MEMYDSRLGGARILAESISDTDGSLNLATVPTGLEPGDYRLRIDAEILLGTYTTGLAFSNLQRGLEGTAAAAHRAGTKVRHVISGDSINNLLNVRTQDGITNAEGIRTLVISDGALEVNGREATIHGGRGAQQPQARPAGVRLYQFNTFS